jgi:hypothetical protein
MLPEQIEARKMMNEVIHAQNGIEPRDVWEFIAELQLRVEELERRLDDSL